MLHLPSVTVRAAAGGEPPAAATAAGAAAGPADAGSVAAQAIEAGRAYLAAGTERLILDAAGGPFPGGTGRQSPARSRPRPSPARSRSSWPAASSRRTWRRPSWRCPRSASTSASGVEIDPSQLAQRGSATARAAARRRLAAPQGPAAGGALRQAGPRGALRPPARPVPPHAGARSRCSNPTSTASWGLDRDFGGRYVPETLVAALDQLEAAWIADPPRPALLGRAARAAVPLRRPAHADLPGRSARGGDRSSGGAAGWRGASGEAAAADRLPDRIRLYLKREDLNHTGAHKLNNALGQVLLTRRLGKSRVIAETGAGMHGVATATACALLEIPCVVHMGVEDIRRQAPNVLRMEALGAEVRPVHGGSGTLKDAVSEALRDWVTNVETSHYCLGSTMGPHPYPMIVRDFQRVIGDEAAAQLYEVEGRLPDMAIACVGGGSNALGLLNRFIGEPGVRLAVAEAAGEGIATGRHAAALLGGTPGILHGSRSYMLQDADGQVIEAVSISAGLDYPGIGPQLAALMAGRPADRLVRDRLGGHRGRSAGRPNRRDSRGGGVGPRRSGPAGSAGLAVADGRSGRAAGVPASRGGGRPGALRPRRQGPGGSGPQEVGDDARLPRSRLAIDLRASGRGRAKAHLGDGRCRPLAAAAPARHERHARRPADRRRLRPCRGRWQGRADPVRRGRLSRPRDLAGRGAGGHRRGRRPARGRLAVFRSSRGRSHSSASDVGRASGRRHAGRLSGLLRAIAAARPDLPLVPMCYANQIIGGGDGRAVATRLAEAGAAGVIVADLTPDEGRPFESVAREVGLAVVYLIAPTTTPERRLRSPAVRAASSTASRSSA